MAIASVTITCSKCGKSFNSRKKCYNRSEANNYESWALSNITLCPDCYREAEAAKRADKMAEQLNRVVEYIGCELPELTGTERQINWATTIRAKALIQMADSFCWRSKVAAPMASLVTSKLSASWWIDHRDDDLEELLNDYYVTEYLPTQPTKAAEEAAAEAANDPEPVKAAKVEAAKTAKAKAAEASEALETTKAKAAEVAEALEAAQTTEAQSDDNTTTNTKEVTTMQSKYQYIVDLDHYVAGSGLSYSETFDTGVSDELLSALEWWDATFYGEVDPDNPDWCVCRIRFYLADADPMFDEPVYTDEATCDYTLDA